MRGRLADELWRDVGLVGRLGDTGGLIVGLVALADGINDDKGMVGGFTVREGLIDGLVNIRRDGDMEKIFALTGR